MSVGTTICLMSNGLMAHVSTNDYAPPGTVRQGRQALSAGDD
jgi:hypothetical protein